MCSQESSKHQDRTDSDKAKDQLCFTWRRCAMMADPK